ncbi:hypothetical protein D8B30_13095 [Verminephrobacter eiseniae]|nr:hypothetical protein [Verminephrobacter eiseniae]MCW8190683.1 hypothetical protein [Verminephrobacter eiseniae]
MKKRPESMHKANTVIIGVLLTRMIDGFIAKVRIWFFLLLRKHEVLHQSKIHKARTKVMQ